MYHSTGREPRAFTVSSLKRLPGQHRQALQKAVPLHEKPQLIIYCPIWNGEQGIWGHNGSDASHALVLNRHTLFFSRDYHDGQEPIVYIIPLKSIIRFELGSALLCAWFTIDYVTERFKIRRLEILFNVHIKKDFSKIIDRWYRSVFKTSLPIISNQQTLTKENGLIENIILPPIRKKKGRSWMVIAHFQQLFLTATNCVIVQKSETPPRDGQLVFAESLAYYRPLKHPFYTTFNTENKIILEYKYEERLMGAFELYPQNNPKINSILMRWNKALKQKDQEIFA